MADVDLAILGQDPRFPGGATALGNAFRDAATALGRVPTSYWLAYRGLRGRESPRTQLRGHGVSAPFPGLDGLNQLVAARRLAPRLRTASSVWVVSTVASHGFGAALAERRYGAWIGTTLDDEWGSRRAALDRPHRIALAASARMLRRLERQTLQRATRIYAISKPTAAAIAHVAGVPEREVGILPVPVDVEGFSPLPDDEWQAGLTQPTIAFVGRGDDPRKNLGLLLDAFRRVRATVPEARLLLIGSGPGVEQPGVQTTGEVPEVAPLLRRCALLVLPSFQEGFGIVAAESLACGVPVVTTPSGGPEELVRASRGGRVLAGFDAEELASSLLDLLGDASTLNEMRRAGREHVVAVHAPARFEQLLAAAFAEVDG